MRDALADLGAAGDRTAAALDASTGALVPGGAGLTPAELFGRVTSTPAACTALPCTVGRPR